MKYIVLSDLSDNKIFHHSKYDLEIDANNNKFYYLNKRYHREDGPAIELANGDKYWYLHGKIHREDGPAIELINGYKEWWYHDKYLNCSCQEEFQRLLKLKGFW